MDDDLYTAEHFSQNLNTKFRVNIDSTEPVEIELVDVAVRKIEPSEQQGMERFSAFFIGPSKIFLPQQTYSVSHPQMGEMDLFLVAIANDQRGVRYEAVFNRFSSD